MLRADLPFCFIRLWGPMSILSELRQWLKPKQGWFGDRVLQLYIIPCQCWAERLLPDSQNCRLAGTFQFTLFNSFFYRGGIWSSVRLKNIILTFNSYQILYRWRVKSEFTHIGSLGKKWDDAQLWPRQPVIPILNISCERMSFHR